MFGIQICTLRSPTPDRADPSQTLAPSPGHTQAQDSSHTLAIPNTGRNPSHTPSHTLNCPTTVLNPSHTPSQTLIHNDPTLPLPTGADSQGRQVGLATTREGSSAGGNTSPGSGQLSGVSNVNVLVTFLYRSSLFTVGQFH